MPRYINNLLAENSAEFVDNCGQIAVGNYGFISLARCALSCRISARKFARDISMSVDALRLVQITLNNIIKLGDFQ
jgi:hypothetical protein